MFDITRDQQQFAGAEPNLCTVDNGEAVPVDAHHQVILPGAFRSPSKVIGRIGKPADVRRVNRSNQRVLPGSRKDRSWNHEHILPGKAVPWMQVRHSMVSDVRKNIHQK